MTPFEKKHIERTHATCEGTRFLMGLISIQALVSDISINIGVESPRTWRLSVQAVMRLSALL